jgi:tripartite ATP-independent transporter DctM subunit
MDLLLAGTIAVCLMFVPIVIGIPIAACIGLAGFVGFALIAGVDAAASLFGVETVSALTNLEVAAIPLFLLMGSFAGASGMAADMYRVAYALIGHFRGGLAAATILGCAGMGAICGSSLATAATFARVAMPEMMQRGYSPRLASGSIASGGTLGILIPPSIVMIIYAVLAEQSILSLYVAAIVPGAIAVLLLLVSLAIQVRMDPSLAPPGPRVTRTETLRIVWESMPTFGIIGLTIGGLYGGVFTVTETAAVGAALALLLTFFRRRLTWQVLQDCIVETASTAAMIYLILISTSVFSYVLSVSTMTEAAVSFVLGLGVDGWVIIFIFLITYILLGCVFDVIAAIVLTLPVVFPVVMGLGYDPVWWGILMVMVVEVGLITPPFGLNVFVVHATLRTVPLTTIFRGIYPFVTADLVRVAIVALFPLTATWLVSVVRG